MQIIFDPLIFNQCIHLKVISITASAANSCMQKLNWKPISHKCITDDNYFTIESKAFPKLWQNPGGSYTFGKRHLQTSTQLIVYRKERGRCAVYAWSWCYASPQIKPAPPKSVHLC